MNGMKKLLGVIGILALAGRDASGSGARGSARFVRADYDR
jgi:hypothetical protein